MIVRASGSSLQLISQPDHAALAARVMKAWRADGLAASGRRSDILVAVEEHDNGWREVDAAPLVDEATGRLLDFLAAPPDVRRAVWPRGVSRLDGMPYAAALVAQHALHIHRRFRDEASWAGFFRDMETAREHHLAAAGLRNRDDLRRDYLFVRIGDLASLAFCNAWTEPQTDDSGSGYGMHLEGDVLVVNPDPFEGREVKLEVPARVMPARSYRSADDARAAYAAAPAVTIRGTARGA
jgi:hypothetical protein